jgi:hypothetical protein
MIAIFDQKLPTFKQNAAILCQKLIIPLVCKKMAIFRRKLVKIAENTDRNVDPTAFPTYT